MSSTSRTISASPSEVFAVLSDGWLYATWVVGASRIRAVETAWPAVGSNISHSVGAWPLLIDDKTEVTECVPDERLRLKARAWPGGEADVIIDIAADPAGARVTITEDVVSGPARGIPAPIRSVLLDVRNKETLNRLSFLAEHKARP